MAGGAAGAWVMYVQKSIFLQQTDTYKFPSKKQKKFKIKRILFEFCCLSLCYMIFYLYHTTCGQIEWGPDNLRNQPLYILVYRLRHLSAWRSYL